MKHLVVQQDFVGGWNVHEVGAELALLYRSDRLRAEGYARRLCSPEGGSVTVIGHTGAVLSEYSAKGAGRTLLLDAGKKRRGRRGATGRSGSFAR
ncbi:hypothetical protein [Ornithinimicrobium pekingense]|uniref:Uncharacterized protein n=1 Tax=Ornithinimicrobium pekingense TaxID=384677 RepID=A0ABQ2FB34_9MICO|nr:hypothetical protein [Ornithinimicrobium pekingense]GGK79074.1 hypothetical protein GCM10011509_29510 [Ornithinimicrobium pekingense]